MAAGHEPRRRAVLDGPDLAIRTDRSAARPSARHASRNVRHAASRSSAGLVEEVVEPAADQLGQRQTEQAAGGGIGVDELARIVDDEHGVAGGREERFGLSGARHVVHRGADPLTLLPPPGGRQEPGAE